MSRWRYLIAAVSLGFLSTTALAETTVTAAPSLPPYKTVPGPDNVRLTFYRAQGDLAQMYSIGKHEFCALAGMSQSNTGAPCACRVDFRKDDGWEFVLMTESVLGHDLNISQRQHCACEVVCRDGPKTAN